ncbi:hypothetical protein D9757_013027 [Collybiopsis confluens]|uniref:Uncharacterized protein n=1 Tax=Collybiopsis confluens TaxID=2823264 RepID=A0A8H5G5M5_9AGAR|nr:hypothetical protein D9757_013027 [Collybiopsis confluens]
MSSSNSSSTPYSSDPAPSSSSTANLIPKASTTKKDYFAAFTSLQSTYGVGGTPTSVPVQGSNRKAPSSSSVAAGGHPSAPYGSLSNKPGSYTQSGKNYEDAFAALYAKHGAPGGGMSSTRSRK